MVKKKSRKVKAEQQADTEKVAVNENAEAEIPQIAFESAETTPKVEIKPAVEPVWIRVYFSDGRIFKIAYQQLKKEVEARFGYLTGAASVGHVLDDCSKIPWAVFRNSAIQVMREHQDNEEDAWIASRKEIVTM